jgi:hypothetical protein
MNASTPDAGGNGQPPKSPARAIRAHLATVLATAALFLAVAGVVYGPAFVADESIVAQQTPTLGLLPTVSAALRQ